MTNIDLIYICTNLSNLCGIPVRLYENGIRIFFRSLTPIPKDPVDIYKGDILAISSHVGYFITPQFHYYGIVNSGGFKIVIGPSRQTTNTPQELHRLAFLADVPADEVSAFMDSMNQIGRMPLESILQSLCMINYVLNGEKLELKDISLYDNPQPELLPSLSRPKNEAGPAAPDAHAALASEQTIMNFIRKGDTAALKDWTAHAPAINSGILAANQLRHVKNTFVVTVTLACRSAIRGGMDIDDAMALSDTWIQTCELQNDISKITNLQYHMVMDFTQQVEHIRRGRHPSRLVIDVTNYIRHHLSEYITTQAIAESLFMSRPYLSKKFKEDSGMTLSDYILQEKAEEGKRLLGDTSKSLAAISDYLGFSSQSHFTRIFKKYYGVTPGQYRQRLS